MLYLLRGIIMNRIKELRNKKGYTQAELSKMLNIEERTLRRWETEDVPLKREKISKLINIFNVSEPYLLGYSKKFEEIDFDLDLFSIGFEPSELVELDEEFLNKTLKNLKILQKTSINMDQDNKKKSVSEVMNVLEQINSIDSSKIFDLAQDLLQKNLLEQLSTYNLIEKYYHQNKK